MLVTIETGGSLARFCHRGRTGEWNLTAGSTGYFASGTHLYAQQWQWSRARRVELTLDSAELLWPELAEGPHGAAHWSTDIEFHDDALSAVMQRMAREIAAGCPNGALYAQSLSLGVVMHLRQRSTQTHQRERGQLSTASLDRVTDYILAHLGEDLRLDDLAAIAGYSTPQFTRLFRRSTGCSPLQFVQQQRQIQALALLKQTGLSLAMVAEQVGYSSQSHMSVAFARTGAPSPGMVRREARGRTPG
ncbi:AraC family transcriptional regulator [Pseudaquabacterium rugosum]|uniref:AraC family transcriptional regulator n=1 Tax=Pseudaquabacterium rugosum TaxID=2984194 RepID=A0ABU9BJA2_9BURK